MKVARTEPLYEREKEVYLRLYEREVRDVEGFAVLSWLAANAETDFRADEGLAQ